MSVDGVTPGSLRTYYRGADCTVTNEYINGPRGRFRVADLIEVRRVRIPSPSARVVRVAMWTVLLLGVVAVVLAFVRSGFGLAAGMVGLTLFVEVVLQIVRTSAGERWELHAMVRGQNLLLYSTIDALAFAQVTRALNRATEDSLRR